MLERQAQLILKPGIQESGRRFRHTQIVADVLAQIDLDSHRFLLIEDDRGELLGIVEVEELLQRVASPNFIERRRWCDMALGSAIGARLDCYQKNQSEDWKKLGAESEVKIDGYTVSTAKDDMAALLIEDELYLRWSSIKRILDDALVDPVTRLPNRLVFERRIEEEWQRLTRNSTSLCVVLIDLDFFKQINDEFGHSVGDQVLLEVGNVIRSQLRSYDLLVRYGGDEFAAVLSGCTASQLNIPIRRIQEGVRKIAIQSLPELPTLSLSIGAAMIRSQLDSPTTEDLVNQADNCLYAAKQNGRDCAYVLDMTRNGAVPTEVFGSNVMGLDDSQPLL
ncbi:GGDEF domain-containing protein [Thalassoglobus sp. JC818]|uniref:GGDEF domain-containing protein n=1 Tax=Thalassoglobus sp. JC818 TaxID=3232136 RepID=UPI00345870F4